MNNFFNDDYDNVQDMKKKALITGVTGQDGALLSEFLLKKNYEVHGIKRRSSSFNTARVDHLYKDPHEFKTNFFLHYGDVTDATNIIRLFQEIKPDEIYNLAAQSHVQVIFYTHPALQQIMSRWNYLLQLVYQRWLNCLPIR